MSWIVLNSPNVVQSSNIASRWITQSVAKTFNLSKWITQSIAKTLAISRNIIAFVRSAFASSRYILQVTLKNIFISRTLLDVLGNTVKYTIRVKKRLTQFFK